MEQINERRNSEQRDKKRNLVFEGDVLEVVTVDTKIKKHFLVKYGEFQDDNAITDDWTLGWYLEGNGAILTLLQEYNGERQLETVLEVVGNVQDNPDLLTHIEFKR